MMIIYRDLYGQIIYSADKNQPGVSDHLLGKNEINLLMSEN